MEGLLTIMSQLFLTRQIRQSETMSAPLPGPTEGIAALAGFVSTGGETEWGVFELLAAGAGGSSDCSCSSAGSGDKSPAVSSGLSASFLEGGAIPGRIETEKQSDTTRDTSLHLVLTNAELLPLLLTKSPCRKWCT